MEVRNKGVLTRTVTRRECDWLENDLPEGTRVFRHTGQKFGISSPNHIQVTLQPHTEPHFSIPENAIRWVS